MTQKNKGTNLIRQRYNAASTNYALCADVTKLGKLGELYLIVDLASRCIVGHAYTDKQMDTALIIKTNLETFKQRNFLPPAVIFHTDRESLFANTLYEQSMQNQNVQVSRGSSEAFQNQVVESLNRTVKSILKTIIMAKHMGCTDIKEIRKTRIFQTVTSIDSTKMERFVKQTIEVYNNKKHSKLNGGLTPNQMEEALFHKNQNRHPEQKQMITQEGTIEDASMKVYQAQVVQQYKGDWQRFFIEWRREQDQKLNKVIDKLDQRAALAELHEKAALQKYQSLYEKHMEMQKKIHFLHEQAKRAQDELQTKAQRKEARSNAAKSQLRQAVDREEFNTIVRGIKAKSAYIKARRTTALYIMYLTGLRVSNLLTLNAGQLRQLLSKGHTEITLIKGGPRRHPIRLAYKGHIMLKKIEASIELAIEGKQHEQPAFTATANSVQPISEWTFERELNEILKQASVKLQKHVRTHSFRATVVSELLKSKTPLHEVQQIIGHRSIGATLAYNRNNLTVKEIDKIVNKRYQLPAQEEEGEAREK